MNGAPIDVWNVETFDQPLLAHLQTNAELIRNYLKTSRRHWREHEASDHTMPYPTNPCGSEYMNFVDMIGREMASRTIRAWHYTRLTNEEVDVVRSDGIYLSTLETIRRRFDDQVTAGIFTAEVAEALFAASPFQGEQRESRSNKFWMVSHPLNIKDGGVTLLLSNWGGESAYFWLQDQALETLVAGIGVSRVLELVVPLDATGRAHLAGDAVVATFGRSLGCKPEKKVFDLYSTRALGPEAVIAIHTVGDPAFSRLGRGYPAEFIDVNIDRWDELMATDEENAG